MIVTGIFDSVRYGEMILIPLEIGQDLYELGSNVHGLSVELNDPFFADQIKVKNFIHSSGRLAISNLDRTQQTTLCYHQK